MFFDDSAFRLKRSWRHPRGRSNFMFGAKKGSGTPSGKLNSDLGAPKRSFFLDFLVFLLNCHMLRHSECPRGVPGLRCDLSKFTRRYTCAGFSVYS